MCRAAEESSLRIQAESQKANPLSLNWEAPSLGLFIISNMALVFMSSDL